MTQSISKPISNNSSSSSSSNSGSNSSMEAKKVIGNGTLVNSGNINNNNGSSFGQQQTIANGNHNGFYRQNQRSNSNLNEKSRRNSGNSGSRNFKGRNNGGDNEFVMLQRPTILVKPSSTSNTSNNETETKLLVNEVNILAESKASVSLSQLTRTREPTPEHSNNPKLLVNGGENISLSNGKINKTINFVNLINKTTNDTSSNGNVLVNNNNKLKVKRELVTPLINNQKENQASHAQAQQQQQPANVLVQNQPSSSSSQQLMATPVIMTNAVKVLDDNLQWCDSLQEFLIDQNDFLVIGVLGKRGVGKSTIMSLLANGGGGVGSSGHISKRSNDVFSKASKDSNELGLHRTSGIQAFVTNERTILLDVQPLLSGSALDKSINMDKKGGSLSNNDFKYYENFIEIQSIELACFVLSVCNVVLLTEDWFIDPTLFKILHTAEMLMPNVSMGLSSANTNPSVTSDESYLEHHAHLVYVLNKSEFVNKLDMLKMKSTIENLMKGSKLIYKNSLREFNWFTTNTITRNIYGTNNFKNKLSDSVNFVVIPKVKQKNNTNNAVFLDQEEMDGTVKGSHSLETSAKYLVRELLGVKRNMSSQASVSVLNNVSGAHVTEKRWFLYANKVWEAIRKSQLINEYNRLMT